MPTARETTKPKAKPKARRKTGARSGQSERLPAPTIVIGGGAGNFTVYRAVANSALAKQEGATRPFAITVRFRGGLTKAHREAFALAADRWTTVIVGDLPAVTIDGEEIDDLLIEAEGVDIDGPGNILGQAGPTHLRAKSAGKAAYLPAKGIMSFDKADLKAMQKDQTLVDVITHEMGHVLGIGTIWMAKGLLQGEGSSNPTFHGPQAMKEYGLLKGKKFGPTPVPVENGGGAGTRDSHWRETLFHRELMTGYVGERPNPLSRLTAASLRDMGYVVHIGKAEQYSLPDLRAIAEAGDMMTHIAPIDRGIMLPSIPIVMPD